jgi:hypothetical protein
MHFSYPKIYRSSSYMVDLDLLLVRFWFPDDISKNIQKISSNLVRRLLMTRYSWSLHMSDFYLLSGSPEVIDLIMVYTHSLEKYYT